MDKYKYVVGNIDKAQFEVLVDTETEINEIIAKQSEVGSTFASNLLRKLNRFAPR